MAKPKMFPINMQDGAIEFFKDSEILWFRASIADDRKGAWLRTSQGRFDTSETVAALLGKMSDREIPIVAFTAPDRAIKTLVNAASIRIIRDAAAEIHDKHAGAVLDFGAKLQLAVREATAECQWMIKTATGEELPIAKRGKQPMAAVRTLRGRKPRKLATRRSARPASKKVGSKSGRR